MSQRKRRVPAQPPGQSAAKRTKNPAKSAKTKPKQYTINDELLGLISIPAHLLDVKSWTSKDDTLERSKNRFATVFWGRDDTPSIVYKIEQRGEKILVLCCTSANTDFINEISWDISKKVNFQVVDSNTIEAEVQVKSWQDWHCFSKHVGDHYFWGSENCQHCSEQLGSNEAYLFCYKCAQSFHASCLSTNMALSYQGDGTIRTVESNNPVECLACSEPMRDPSHHQQGTDVASVVLTVDPGTTRTRAKGTHKKIDHYLLDDAESPKPLVSFDTVNKTAYFERRAADENLVIINPLKKIICDNAQLPDGFSTEATLVWFFERLIEVMLPKFERFSLDPLNVNITLAVAIPSGSTLKQKTTVPNAIHNAHKNIKPIVTEEATMSIYSAVATNTSLPKSHLIASVDLGGYTDDSSIHEVDATQAFVYVNTRCAASVHSGDEWVINLAIEKVMNKTGHASRRDFEPHIREYFTDLYANRSLPAEKSIGGIDIIPILQECIAEQPMRATTLFEEQVKDFPRQVDLVILTGGGVRRAERLQQVANVGRAALKPGVSLKVRPTPPSEKSDVLHGLGVYLGMQRNCVNRLTVVIESMSADGTKQFIVLQKIGEATEAPVLPASRSTGTTFFEIQPEDDLQSSHRLLATTETLETMVTDTHFQIAKIDDAMEAKMFELGELKLDLRLEEEVDKSKGFLEVVQTALHEGFSWVTIEALLLAPIEGDHTRWLTWGINESMSIAVIKGMAEDPEAKFKIVRKVEKRYMALDMDNKEARTRFIL